MELVKFTRPSESYEELEKLTNDAEDILKNGTDVLVLLYTHSYVLIIYIKEEKEMFLEKLFN